MPRSSWNSAVLGLVMICLPLAGGCRLHTRGLAAPLDASEQDSVSALDGVRRVPVTGAASPDADVAPVPIDAAVAAAPPDATAQQAPADSGSGPSSLDGSEGGDGRPGSDADVNTQTAPALLSGFSKGLVLYLRLDDAPASIRARDDSPAKGLVVLRQSQEEGWVPGRFGGALRFTASSTGPWIRVESSASLNNIISALSLSAWIRRDSTDTADGTIMSRWAPGARGFLYHLQVVKNQLRLRINSSNGYRADVTGAIALPADRWVHVAVTFDRRDVRLYVDGKLSAMDAYALDIPPENSPLIFGAAQSPQDADLVVERLAAALDEIMLFSRALTAAEIAQLAAGARPGI